MVTIEIKTYYIKANHGLASFLCNRVKREFNFYGVFVGLLIYESIFICLTLQHRILGK